MKRILSARLFKRSGGFALLFLILISLIQNTLARSREEIFREIVELQNRYPEWFGNGDSEADELLKEFGEEASGSVSDTMLGLLFSVSENPIYYKSVRRAAVSALNLFPQELVLDRLLIYLGDDVIKSATAGVLVEWGYWEEALPAIIEREAWQHLRKVPDSVAVPILHSAADSSNTILGRLYAAIELEYYNDHYSYLKTSRDILRKYLVEYGAVEDTLDLARAVEIACRQIWNETDENDIYFFIAGTFYSAPSIRTETIHALYMRARNGNKFALELLEGISKNHPFDDAKEKAQARLRWLVKK